MTKRNNLEQVTRLSAEGNNGGDVLEIVVLPDGRLHLAVGHCCVREINHVVPVEFVTALLTQVILDKGGVEEAMRSVSWPAAYIDELVAKIESR